VRAPGFARLQAARAAGLQKGMASVTSAMVRMMGAAIPFGAGLPLEFFATYDDALARAKELAAGARGAPRSDRSGPDAARSGRHAGAQAPRRS
jgi:hypothetical protein